MKLWFFDTLTFFKNKSLQAFSLFNRITLTNIILFSLTINFFVSWYLQQIKNINFGTSIGFYYLDTNCPDRRFSLISHCFGDFQTFLNSNEMPYDIRWATEIYPPANKILFYPFDLINQYISNNFALISYFIVAVIMNIFGSHMLLKLNNLKSNLFIWVILNFSSLPMLVALERGNLIIFVPFLLLLLLTGLIKNNMNYVYVSTSLLILVKPQYALILVFLFIVMQKLIFPVVISISYGLLNLVLSYLQYGSPLSFVKNFLSSINSLNDMQKISDLWPINISPIHSIAKFGLKIGYVPDTLLYSILVLSFFVLFLIYLRYKTKSLITVKLTSFYIYSVFFVFCFSFAIYSHSPIYYLIFAFVFWYMYEYNLTLFGGVFFNFIIRTNLIFMTFYFPIFRSIATLTRFQNETKVFLTYNSYLLLLLNISAFVLFISTIKKEHNQNRYTSSSAIK